MQRIDHVVQNPLCVFGMTVALMSVEQRRREQQQRGNNQTSSHWGINSENSRDKETEEPGCDQQGHEAADSESTYARRSSACVQER